MSPPRDPDALSATLEELLCTIRLRFYLHRPGDYRRDRNRLLYAVTWPATWLDERGLTCAPKYYHRLIEERLQAIAAHGNPATYGAYFPAYLLKCLQDWFDRYGDELYGELKHIRNALDQLLSSALLCRACPEPRPPTRPARLHPPPPRTPPRRPQGPRDRSTHPFLIVTAPIK